MAPVQLSRDDFAAALQTVQHAVANRSTLPILTGILIQVTSDGNMLLTATDLEIAIQSSIPCSPGSDISIVLPARYITELVRRSPVEKLEVSLRTEDWTAALRWPGSEFSVNGYDPEQFPQLPPVQSNVRLTVPGEHLIASLQKTLFCVSQDETRPVLTGAEISLSEKGISAISTDGFRISFVQLGEKQEQQHKMVIPGRSLQQLSRVLPVEDDCTLEMGSGQVAFRTQKVLFLARTLSDSFPAVLDLVPSEFPIQMRCDRRMLLSACERMALVAETRDRPNAVHLSLQENKLILRANSPEVGNAFEELNIVSSGGPLEVSFNARYLIEGLKAIDADEISFSFSGPLSAARMQGTGNEQYRYIVLPMRSS